MEQVVPLLAATIMAVYLVNRTHVLEREWLLDFLAVLGLYLLALKGLFA